MKVTWSNAIPAEVKAAALPYVKRYLPSLPCWVERFAIEYDAEANKDGETVYLSVQVQEEMRCATLNLRADWLSLDAEQREDTISHEFAHIAFLPAAAICDEILLLGQSPTPLRTQWEARVEAATQDYAKVFRRAYGR